MHLIYKNTTMGGTWREKICRLPRILFSFFLWPKIEGVGGKEHLQKSVFLSHYGMEISLTLSCSAGMSFTPEKTNTQTRASQPVWTSQWEESPTSSIPLSFQWGHVLSAEELDWTSNLQAVRRKVPWSLLHTLSVSQAGYRMATQHVSWGRQHDTTERKKERKKEREDEQKNKSCQWCSERSHSTSLSYGQAFLKPTLKSWMWMSVLIHTFWDDMVVFLGLCQESAIHQDNAISTHYIFWK